MTPRLLSALLLAAALLLAGPVPGETGGAHGVAGPGGRPTWGGTWGSGRPWGHRSGHGWPRAWWTPNGWAPWTPAVEAPAPAFPVWYFCQSRQAYFPDVLDCAEGWTPVLPQGAQ